MEAQPAAQKTSIPRGVWLSLLVIGLMTLAALFASVISPYNPTRMEIGQANHPPAWYNGPGRVGHAEHLLGTDRFGRDIFSRLIHGARAAMFLVLIALPLTAFIGVLVGVTAAMGNKTIETIFLRITDTVSSVPSFMFAVIVIFIVRPTPTGEIFGGLVTLTLAFVLVNWVTLARLIYTSVLKIKEQEFMEAARSLGAGKSHQVFKHILPHVAHLVIVWVVSNIPAVILLEALMGYIGIQILQRTDGSSFQDLSWGGLIFMGRSNLKLNPYMLLAPTLCILALSMSFSILGEYLRERTNPQLGANEIV
jgi:ABC-type dipeptide/oligopeptide/nickel transport system permease subunit